MARDHGPILEIRDLVTGYRQKSVLNHISLEMFSGEIIAILGRNGAGKSTLLKSIFGLLAIWSGQVLVDGTEIRNLSPRTLLASGIVYVPQGHRVFDDLSVRENLLIVTGSRGFPSRPETILDHTGHFFPQLQRRLSQRAGSLSGGEKQMLALAMAVAVPARLLLLDEPCLGVAPMAANDLLHRIKQLCTVQGSAALIVEQRAKDIINISDRAYVLNQGAVSWTGPAIELRSEAAIRKTLFGELSQGSVAP